MPSTIDPVVLAGGWRQRSSGMTRDDWMSLAAQAVNSLAAFLGRPFSIDANAISLGEGFFSVDFRTDDSGPVPWDLRIRGIVGSDVIEDRLLIRSWLFLYSGNRRLSPTGAEYLELELRLHEGASTWIPIGWELGYPGEYDHFATFSVPEAPAPPSWDLIWETVEGAFRELTHEVAKVNSGAEVTTGRTSSQTSPFGAYLSFSRSGAPDAEDLLVSVHCRRDEGRYLLSSGISDPAGAVASGPTITVAGLDWTAVAAWAADVAVFIKSHHPLVRERLRWQAR